VNSVPILNGTNFKDWKENIEIILGCMDLDLALKTEQPPTPTVSSTPEDRRDHEKWVCSNCMSIMIIKRGIPEMFRGTISENITTAKEFLAEWVCSNCMSIMIIKRDIPEVFRGTVSKDITTAKEFLAEWVCSNCMSIMIIKSGILEVFRGTVSEDITTAKEFLVESCVKD